MSIEIFAAPDAANGFVLSSHDAARLEILAFGEAPHLQKLILDKLDQSELVSGDRLAPDIATIGSVLLYRIGSGDAERRTLALPDVSCSNGQFISILTPVGLSLLGCRAGSRIEVIVHDGSVLSLQLLKVEFQPETEARIRSRLIPDSDVRRI